MFLFFSRRMFDSYDLIPIAHFRYSNVGRQTSDPVVKIPTINLAIAGILRVEMTIEFFTRYHRVRL